MRDETIKLLNLRRLPGRLNPEEAAQVLGFQSHDVPVLVKAKLLKPLGSPPQQAVKYFAGNEVEKNAADSDWLHKATKTLYLHWANQNRKRVSRRPTSSTGETESPKSEVFVGNN